MEGQAAPPLIVRRAVADDVTGIARVHVRSWQSAHRGHVPRAVLESLDEGKRASRWRELLEAPGHALQVAVLHGAAPLPVVVGHPIEGHPHVKAWVEDFQRRDSFKAQAAG